MSVGYLGPQGSPMDVRKTVVLEVEGRLVEGQFTASEEWWHLRWPGGEVSFVPPSQPWLGVVGDEALRQFLAEELAPRGIVPHICGTCAYFTFSGMSWDMSGGWVGYCHHNKVDPLDPLRDTVDIWDGCAHWTARESEEVQDEEG